MLPVIAYYGTGRIWKDSKLRNTIKNIDLERSSGYMDCLESTSSYANFGHWVKYAIMSAVEIERIIAEKHLTEKNPYREVFKAVEQAIVTCIGSMGWTDIDYSFVRQNLVLKHKTRGILPIEALSDGARSVISMVADLSYRMICARRFRWCSSLLQRTARRCLQPYRLSQSARCAGTTI